MVANGVTFFTWLNHLSEVNRNYQWIFMKLSLSNEEHFLNYGIIIGN